MNEVKKMKELIKTKVRKRRMGGGGWIGWRGNGENGGEGHSEGRTVGIKETLCGEGRTEV